MTTNFLAGNNGIKLQSVQDAMDMIGSGLPGCVLTLEDLGKEFFDLRNGMAGEVFQKCVLYNFYLAIVLPPDHSFGNRITELARDHSNHNCIRFFPTIEKATVWLEAKIIET